MWRSHAAPLLGIFFATAVVTGALDAAVYSRGLALALGPLGAACHLPALAFLGGATWALLTRVKGLTTAQAGYAAVPADAAWLALGLVGTTAWLALVVALGGALTGHPLTRSAAPWAPGPLLWALLSFTGSSAVQQLTTLGLARAASPASGLSVGGAAVGVGVFLLAHLPVSTDPLYLTNVALFAATSIALFASSEPSRLALPIGFHAGWNFTQLVVLGAPFGGQVVPFAPFTWPVQGPDPWLGGANGLDEGWLFGAALLPWIAFAAWRRRLSG